MSWPVRRTPYSMGTCCPPLDPDPAREEGLRTASWREGEHARPLEEEVASFGEAERKAGQIDAPLIALDLREVRVHAEGGAEAGRHAVVQVEADVARKRGRVGFVGRIAPTADARGYGFQPDALRETLQPRQFAREHETVQAPRSARIPRHRTSSLWRRIDRRKLMPQLPPSGVKFRVRKGIRISADHPSDGARCAPPRSRPTSG